MPQARAGSAATRPATVSDFFQVEEAQAAAVAASERAAAAAERAVASAGFATALKAVAEGRDVPARILSRFTSKSIDLWLDLADPFGLLAILGWAVRKAARVLAQQQLRQLEGERGPRSEDEALRQLLWHARQLLAVFSQVLRGRGEDSGALARAALQAQLPQALVGLCAALVLPGFECCGGSSERGGGGGGGNLRNASSGGSDTNSGFPSSTSTSAAGNANLRLDLLTCVAWCSNSMRLVLGSSAPGAVVCLLESGLIEAMTAALVRAQTAECGRTCGSASSSGSSGGAKLTKSCFGMWLREGTDGGKAWHTWISLFVMVATYTPIPSPRTWFGRGMDGHDVACQQERGRRAALSGPGVQFFIAQLLVALTNRCQPDAAAGAAGAAAGAGGAVTGTCNGGAASDGGGRPPLPQHIPQPRWFGLPARLLASPLLAPPGLTVSATGDSLMEAVELAAQVWNLTVSGPQLPRLGQPPPAELFASFPHGPVMRKVVAGTATPAEAAAAAAAEAAAVPQLHPPSFTAVQVYEMTHAALAVALELAAPSATCVDAPILLSRLLMELKPRQAAARLPGLWLLLPRALARLADAATTDTSPSTGICPADAAGGETFTWMHGPRWLLQHVGLLLQLQLPQPPPLSPPPACVTDSGVPAATATASAATAAAHARPDWAAPDFSLRCALSSGLLPALEGLLRRSCRDAAAAAAAAAGTGGEAAIERFLDAAHLASWALNAVLRTSGVWPAILAHAPLPEVASLLVTVGKMLTVLGDARAALWGQHRIVCADLDVKVVALNNVIVAALAEQAWALGPADHQIRQACSSSSTSSSSTGARDTIRRWSDDSSSSSSSSSAVGSSGREHQGEEYPGHRMLGAATFPALPAAGLVLPINNRIHPDSIQLDLNWMAAAGGCPPAGSVAAHQQQRLTAFALARWLPPLMRHAVRSVTDAPAYAVDAELNYHMLLCQIAFTAACHSLNTSEAGGATPAAAAAAAEAAAGWSRFLMDDLDTAAWLEQMQATAAALGTQPAAGEPPGRADGAMKMVEHLKEAMLHLAQVATPAAPPAPSHEPVGMTAADVEAVEAMRAVGVVLAAALAMPAGAEAVPAGGAAVSRLWPDHASVAAVPGEAGLALCGNPACSSLVGGSEAGLMAAGGEEAGGSRRRIKTCARCRGVRYCCGACQLQHWMQGGHREACPGWQQRKGSDK
ncbi:hypothetical protein HXX76_005464 [Chlamydomonas incerta]|uniref:phytol kinase n=1 Tax=Chlamydomonas incerta TaxID=51695 RepID=A0A835W6Y5_CHLIN|nr:hypothetical protein HXX76_005464 [Chlamydomonas incerta]|eukprot:KAG2437846.1 hypothetical protein HXX76_005464 [Chlamydomonas incerta]